MAAFLAEVPYDPRALQLQAFLRALCSTNFAPFSPAEHFPRRA